MSVISFKTKLIQINSWTLLKLPKNASDKLTSRGVVMVEGTINGYYFQTALEPDGVGSHWFKIDDNISNAIGINVGDTVSLEIESTKKFIEPEVPLDFKNALAASKSAYDAWTDITPMARWDWIRWIRSTKQPETRRKRIDNACDMLISGKRRPCCFNRSLCTETYVSKNGQLLDPSN